MIVGLTNAECDFLDWFAEVENGDDPYVVAEVEKYIESRCSLFSRDHVLPSIRILCFLGEGGSRLLLSRASVGVYFDKDGTMRNEDGSRSTFDDVDE